MIGDRMMPYVLLAAAAALAMPLAHADVDVSGTAHGTSILIDIVSGSDPGITQLRMWFSGNTFESCKTMAGWTCAYDENQVVFSADEPLDDGESARLSLVTAEPASAITWKALAGTEEVGRGVLQPGAPDSAPEPVARADPAPKPVARADPEPAPKPSAGPAITPESVFRMVPDRPNVGATVRVVGESLGALQQFDFYIDGKKAGTFSADESGRFVGTAKIPDDQEPGRVGFKLSGQGGEREISLRIGEAGVRSQAAASAKLDVYDAPERVHRGDMVDISGTGKPGGIITAEITAPDGSVINAIIAEIDQDGTWGTDGGATIPEDAQFGLYTATITDGRETIIRTWTVESDQSIDIRPVRQRFNPGESMAFEGTAPPDARLLVTMEDPGGREIISDIIKTGPDGAVSFEFPTTRKTAEGVYTLIATLGDDREFIYTGLGVLPSTPVNLEFDRFHYEIGATARISFSGEPSATLSLLIVESSNNKEAHKDSVTLGLDGRTTYELDLEGYKNTVYSAIVKKGNIQSEEMFAVNLKENPGSLVIQTTKTRYVPGEQLLITGNTMESGSKQGSPACPTEAPVYLVTLSIAGPDGEDVRQKSSFADSKCQISEKTFRVPTDAAPGVWTVRVVSGTNSATAEFEVADTSRTGIEISVERGADFSDLHKALDIMVTGAKGKVTIEITSQDGAVVDTLNFPADDDGQVNQPWIIPGDLHPGAYTFRASYDKNSSAEATYVIGDDE